MRRRSCDLWRNEEDECANAGLAAGLLCPQFLYDDVSDPAITAAHFVVQPTNILTGGAAFVQQEQTVYGIARGDRQIIKGIASADGADDVPPVRRAQRRLPLPYRAACWSHSDRFHLGPYHGRDAKIISRHMDPAVWLNGLDPFIKEHFFSLRLLKPRCRMIRWGLKESIICRIGVVRYSMR